ncbi:tape measure [Pontimonas phage phiPsal1]|nr:tape measure [Pontimonas phage phiPsal1]
MARGTVNFGIVSKFDNKGISKARTAFKKFGGVAAGVATGAVAAIGGIATAATRMASEFETSFAKIQGLVGVSTEEIGKLEEAAIRLGPQFGKSAQEAADALFFITSSGLRGAEAVDVLEASLKASAAGLGDVEPIANAATAAMNTYGAENLSGADAVDALTEAVRLGQLAPAELSGALGKVIPIAKELGVSFEETTGLVAGLTRGGLSASEAVTGVRGAMQAVLKPTGEAADMLEQYGTSTGEVRSMIEDDGLLATFGHLREMFAGNEEDFTRLIGSQEGLNAVLAMTGEASEEYTDIVSQMTDEVGALDEAFGAVEQTAGFKFDKAMETAKASLLPVGETLLDIGSKLLDDLMPTIELLAPLFEETFAVLEEPLAEMAALIPPVIEAFMPLLPVVGELVGLIAEIAVALMPLFLSVMELLMPIIEIFMTVLESVVDIFIAFLPALTAIVDAIIPLIEAILPVFLDLWKQLEEPILRVIEALIPIIEELLPVLSMIIEELVLPLMILMSEIMGETLVIAIETLATWLEWLGERMSGFAQGFSDTWYDLQTAVYNIINGLIEGFENLANSAIGVLNGIIGAYNKVAEELGLKELDLVAKVSFGRLELPGRFDNMKFDDVDVSGIGSPEGRRFGNRFGDTSALRGVQDLMSGGTGFNQNRSSFRSVGIPQLAKGGIVDGATLAVIGEAGPEAVIPLDKMDRGGSTYNITIQSGVGDPVRIGEDVVNAIKRYERVSGPVFASA